MNIYDPLNHKLIIGPFDYRVYNYIPQCVNLPDDILLKVKKDFEKFKFQIFY